MKYGAKCVLKKQKKATTKLRVTTAVIDTNVLVSGFVRSKPDTAPPIIIDAWLSRRFILILSDHIRIELIRTFSKPYFQNRISPDRMNKIIRLFDTAKISPITALIKGVATHPEDDLILATAISAKADYLVTGDGPMLRKIGKFYQGVNLISPIDFVTILQQD